MISQSFNQRTTCSLDLKDLAIFRGKRMTSSFNERLRIVSMKDCRFFNFERLRNLSSERLCNLSKLKNPAIFHWNNTQSFIERAPFFKHERLPKSFELKESSVLSSKRNTIASIGCIQTIIYWIQMNYIIMILYKTIMQVYLHINCMHISVNHRFQIQLLR